MRFTRAAVIAVLVLSCCAGIADSHIGSAHAATASGGLPIKATLAVKLAALGRFRVGSVFVHAAKDSANVNTDGPWQYYDVTT